jgi:hypothetical protein
MQNLDYGSWSYLCALIAATGYYTCQVCFGIVIFDLVFSLPFDNLCSWRDIWITVADLTLTLIFQQKPVTWSAFFLQDLTDDNVPVVLSFSWAFQWYHFHLKQNEIAISSSDCRWFPFFYIYRLESDSCKWQRQNNLLT